MCIRPARPWVQVFLNACSPAAGVAACRYRIRAFSDVHGRHTTNAKRWLELWDHLEKYCWVVSWNSAHQLDTLALLRLKMGTFYKHTCQGRSHFVALLQVHRLQMILHVLESCLSLHRQNLDSLLHQCNHRLQTTLLTCAQCGAGIPHVFW